MALKRLQKELIELQKEPIENVHASPDDDDMFAWKGMIQGPTSSPYKGGTFKFNLNFEQEYPFKPPKIKFTTKIYHPNVDEDGSICIGLLKSESWKPATKLPVILRALYQLLQEPNPDDALQANIAEVYNKDKAKYNATAMEVRLIRMFITENANCMKWVQKYAK